MWKLLQIEVFKIFKRPRTYIAFGAVAAIVLLFQVGMKYDGQSYLNLMIAAIKDTFDIRIPDEVKILNGYFVCFLILNMLLIQMPLLVALVAGDAIAGEANMGTLRLSLTKPVSRTQYVLIKFMACMVYTTMLLLWLALIGLFGSMLIFGTNDLIVIRSGGVEHLTEGDVLWRYFAAFAFATVALTTVAALAFLLSVFGENSIGPIIATMSIVVVFTILSELNIPMYDRTIKPWLFTTHMIAWKGFFYIKVAEVAEGDFQPVAGSISNLGAIMKSLGILLAYIGVFLTAAIIAFRKKDILS